MKYSAFVNFIFGVKFPLVSNGQLNWHPLTFHSAYIVTYLVTSNNLASYLTLLNILSNFRKQFIPHKYTRLLAELRLCFRAVHPDEFLSHRSPASVCAMAVGRSADVSRLLDDINGENNRGVCLRQLRQQPARSTN